ncbi:RagB/SusD family nutrient uptake outer membrane protein [Pseudobacter ginsenosidimutans]|uniref:SusD-like starch-binding protein associating with outer membrane n=1 Tax=Pseudobacter ginsenosidimutans TaxID=661488 RepID=A0A4Q7N6C5_9BACT|nr:RagB/SusD family nutrient uptake outer membrane protein [Pseudobacter ginsenosidimutans]RZS76648.1 SusD-like starch-binding protein associating with outer membrane [Pseudobacter ginsenosidimutans]
MYSTNSRILTYVICILSISGISCKKFLASYSQNNSFIETTNDLDELLVGEVYFKLGYALPEMFFTMDDDVEMGKPGSNNANGLQGKGTGFYYWLANPAMDNDGTITTTDYFYSDPYRKIASINLILHSVSVLRDKGEPAVELNRISGEAHFLRAFYYFIMMNIYGKPYKPSTAATDFGIPLKTDPAIKDQFASRSSAKQVYELIIADLLAAEQELSGANTSSTIRVNQPAVQALLSRVYLFMENYEKAILYADKVISNNRYQIVNLNNHIAGNDFLTRNASEVVFTMSRDPFPTVMFLGTEAPPVAFYRISDDLAGIYSQNDLRREVFFIPTSKGYLKLGKKRKAINGTNDDVSAIFLVRLSEIYLNKAEALAALDRFEEARNTLQELRKKRFKPDELTPVIAAGATLMNEIREERRRELCFETHRWFDLRRYGVNTKYPYSKSIRHRTYTFTGTDHVDYGYYELGPYQQDAAAYIVPIPQDEIEFNNGLLTNEPRPDRQRKQ